MLTITLKTETLIMYPIINKVLISQKEYGAKKEANLTSIDSRLASFNYCLMLLLLDETTVARYIAP